ncbi:MAG: hypothetical protein AAF628_26445 [Planctomycetota bacterium]
MFGEREAAPTTSDLELVEELELNTVEEIADARKHDTLQLKVPTTLDAGNASQRGDELRGTSQEVSSAGMTGTFGRPVLVGDIYWLSFDRAELDVAPTYALCRQCKLLDSGQFQAELTFFHKIEIT